MGHKINEFYQRVWWRLARSFVSHKLSISQFESLLERMGINSGKTVLLHCSLDEIVRHVPDLNAITLLELLQNRLTTAGTLLMPTFPFRGSQYEHLQKCTTFNLQLSHSMTGLLSEIFRRSKGVVRSRHPTHPITAWGKHAKLLTDTHHLGDAFDKTSPFYLLTHVDGLIVGLGTDSHSFTISHTAERLHPKTYNLVFCREGVLTTIKDKKNSYEQIVYPLCPGVKRDFVRVQQELLKMGALARYQAKGLYCFSGSGADILAGEKKLIEQNRFFYDLNGF
ncbi:MAG: AAC(3) family N-acetyltransferase [Magnetococcales bacterium]|nr:AAC(3) family N-acetyltransferase [Magnetococcales bacterium]